MTKETQLSPRGEVVFGLPCAACGAVPLLAWGFFRSRQVMELRVAVAAGLVFIMLGAALVAALPSNRNGQQPIA